LAVYQHSKNACLQGHFCDHRGLKPRSLLRNKNTEGGFESRACFGV